jgi:putative isomerase
MTMLQRYLTDQIAQILRPPAKSLPFPYLVPGGIFLDQLWDWDSFWITKGALPLLRNVEAGQRETFLEHAAGSWKNFLENQAPNGALPIMSMPDRPDFFECTRDGGLEKNQGKPIFGQFAREIARFTGDYSWIAPYFDRLLKFYDRWFSHYGTGVGLVVWGSDVAIGTDNDPATYGRPEFSSASLLLNCLLYEDVTAAAEIADALQRPQDAGSLRKRADGLKAAILRECWDGVDEFFYTVDVQCGDHRARYLPDIKRGMDTSWSTVPLKIKSFSGFLPMWCGIAEPRQVEALVKRHFLNPAEFHVRWGMSSLARNERMYEPETDSANPSNWLGPVWIVASYMVYEGLRKYHYHAEADALGAKTVELLESDLAKTGKLHECYHPETGKPNFNDDFLSWNVLAGLMTPKS